ncbi:MAG: hypothetical protein VYE64_01930 [Planctomycetota bacterium]|nr:hypothetical protein [Planctomycetota bacterium]
MSQRISPPSPWADEDAQAWLTSSGGWQKIGRLIRSTLSLEPSEHPHQIRAAASLVILFGRQGLWPQETTDDLDEVVDLARRKLVLIKAFFTSEARVKGNLTSNPAFKELMESLDQEIRILESRSNDEPTGKSQQPPASWGPFWQT